MARGRYHGVVMKLCSFDHDAGAGWGVLVEGGIAQLSAASPWPTLEAALAADALGQLEPWIAQAPRLALAAVTWRPPLPGAAVRYLCIGVNYRDHAGEMGRTLPEYPTVFIRFASSLVGHDVPVVAPRASSSFDYEGELAVVIGRPGRRIPAARVLEHVAGYACFGDHSVRDYQRHTSQFTPGKNFDRSGAFGPWIVTRDEIPDPAALVLETRVNGSLRQSASVSELIFDVPAIIAYLSEVMELRPGDVIATGTPAGVAAARGPEFYLRPGDVVEVSISGLGALRNEVVAEAG
jgi:2-keto-4-pentenoate hydratase/2-oxohepta-3-ene-1,7-dioic acid hydratase in catechol pathway